MKFGVNTFIWTAGFDRSNLHILPAIKAAGFDGIEVPLFHPGDFAAADIRKGLADNGLECTCCSILTGGLNIISEDAAVRAKTRTHLEDCAKAAAEVGSKIIAGPLYSPVGHFTGSRRTDDEWKRAIECYQSLGPTLAAYNVTIALEPLNRFEGDLLNTVDQGLDFLKTLDAPAVGLLVDTFHVNIEESSWTGPYRRAMAAGRLFHVHLGDNNRLPPGQGLIDFAAILAALHAAGYDGWLSAELLGRPDPDTAARQTVEHITPLMKALA